MFAAYLLQQGTNAYGFGRGAEKPTRRQTRFLFYLVVIDLLKDALSRGSYNTDIRTISDALVAILQNNDAKSALLDPAIEVIDSYFSQGTDDSVFDEAAYIKNFPDNVNAFLRWETLGRAEESTPRLRSLLAITKQVMGRTVAGHPSPRSLLQTAIKDVVASKCLSSINSNGISWRPFLLPKNNRECCMRH